jgi:hypothetical protein
MISNFNHADTRESYYFFSSEQTGETEWFNSSGPAQFDNNLEYLCSGAFGGDNAYVVFSII